MSYKENERIKWANSTSDIFGGNYQGKERYFVLRDPYINIWEGIRYDVLNYFRLNNITWWGENQGPTGHLLSSQIACLNYLYPFRQRVDAVSLILSSIDNKYKQAVKIDKGYIEFEVIGSKNYLNEKAHTRGSNCTSVDALMLAEEESGERTLVFIEWKYVEDYPVVNKLEGNSGKVRSEIYFPFLNSSDSPFNIKDISQLFYEPFYQLMRQTLLAEQMVKNNEYGATKYIHIHVIPKKNDDLLNRITSPGLTGKSITSIWKTILKDSSKYYNIDPFDFVNSAFLNEDTITIKNYLERRYR